MTPATSVQTYRPIFNDFLYAPVDHGFNGDPLSLLSAFARLGVDPWREAAALAALPRQTAERRLAGLLERLPGRPWAKTESGAIASRLLQLLPSGRSASVPETRTLIDSARNIQSTDIKLVIGVAVGIYLVALAIYQFV